MSEWISTADRLPAMREVYKDSPLQSGLVLIYNGHYVHIGSYAETFTKRKPRWINHLGNVENVTHWMPLPDAPK